MNTKYKPNSQISNKLSSPKNTLISLAFMFGLFMPDGNLFYYLVPIFILILAIRYHKFQDALISQYLIIILICVSFFLHAITNSDDGDIKGYLRNIVIVEMFLFYPFAKAIKISNAYLYFALIYIFISQISYMIGIDPLITFFNDYYPYEGDRYWYQSDYLISNADSMSLINRNFRLGGLFHNANLCAIFLTIILAVYLIENFGKSIKYKLPFIIIYSMAIVGTGSRTGFFVSFLIIIYSIYLRYKNIRNVVSYIYMLVALVGVTVFIYLLSSGIASDLRFLDYEEGLEKSFFVKVQILVHYLLSDPSLLHFLFGNFINAGSNFIQFDSEIGELIYNFGFTALIAWLLFFRMIYKRMDPNHRMFFIIFLWTLTATLMFAYRVGFVFMLILSKYDSGSLKINYKNI